MKVGIVVPFSWSFWGAVNEHAELQAEALGKLGIETRTIIGNDPPGTFTRALHPRHGRHGEPPDDVIPVGRSVIVPANGSLPNIVLTPSVPSRLRRVLAEGDAAPGHVFNLGHGVLPGTDPDVLTRVVELVHQESAR